MAIKTTAKEVLAPERPRLIAPAEILRPSASGKPKVPMSIRIDADALEALRATGHGWQKRLNDWLRAALLP